jgi:phosphate uptake regulator
MHIRRLVKSGAASHTISLPIEWLTKHELKKGDLLYIKEDGSNLILSKGLKEEKQELKEITIGIDDKEINTLRRETISAYINNYNIFTFIGKSLNQKLEEIKKILDNFLALEIIEQTETKLVAKDFLNLNEFSLHNTLRRMDMLTRSMLIDSKKGTKESLEFRDYEIDKLFFLISRLTRANLQKTDQNSIESFQSWWLAKNLESISDSAKKIKLNKEAKEFYNKIEEYYINCITSYFKKDKQKADELIASRQELLEQSDKLEEREHLKNIINSSRNIAKIILDSE